MIEMTITNPNAKLLTMDEKIMLGQAINLAVNTTAHELAQAGTKIDNKDLFKARASNWIPVMLEIIREAQDEVAKERMDRLRAAMPPTAKDYRGIEIQSL